MAGSRRPLPEGQVRQRFTVVFLRKSLLKFGRPASQSTSTLDFCMATNYTRAIFGPSVQCRPLKKRIGHKRPPRGETLEKCPEPILGGLPSKQGLQIGGCRRWALFCACPCGLEACGLEMERSGLPDPLVVL
jgi:hypothetical protein